MKQIVFLLFVILIVQELPAQAPSVAKVEPPNWWINMKHNKIQLMVYGEHLNGVEATTLSSDIIIQKTYSLPNPFTPLLTLKLGGPQSPA